MRKGIIENDYMKLKHQLSKYKNRAGDFKQSGKQLPFALISVAAERQSEIKNENLILLNKMKQIQDGKQVSKERPVAN